MDRYELRRLDYSLSDDHEALQAAYKDFFKTHCSIEAVRAAEASGFDKSLWERLCAMGATSMALPEASGGDGATLVDLTLVAEEVGRSLAPVPWIDHVVAARLLARLGTIEADVVSGKQLAALDPQQDPVSGVRLIPTGSIADHIIVRDGPNFKTSSGWRSAPGPRRSTTSAGCRWRGSIQAPPTVAPCSAAAVKRWRNTSARWMNGEC